MKACASHKPEEAIASHYPDAVQWGGELPRHPQPAWLEFYSTGFVAETLSAWGYEVLQGENIIDAGKGLVVPDAETLQAEYERALKAGIKEEFVAPAKGGFTGAVGILKGASPGPTVAFRFDIDSLEILALSAPLPSHRPKAASRERWVS